MSTRGTERSAHGAWTRIERVQKLEASRPRSALKEYEDLRRLGRWFHWDLLAASVALPALGMVGAYGLFWQFNRHPEPLAALLITVLPFAAVELLFAIKARRHLPPPVPGAVTIASLFLAFLYLEGALLIGVPWAVGGLVPAKIDSVWRWCLQALSLVATLYVAAYPLSPLAAHRYADEVKRELRRSDESGLFHVGHTLVKMWQGRGADYVVMYLIRRLERFLKRRSQDLGTLLTMGWRRVAFAYAGVAVVALTVWIATRDDLFRAPWYASGCGGAVAGLLLGVSHAWIERDQSATDQIGLGLARCLYRLGRPAAARFRANEVLDSPSALPQKRRVALALLCLEESDGARGPDIRPLLQRYLAQADMFVTDIEAAAVSLTRLLAKMEDPVSTLSGPWRDVLVELMSGDIGLMAEGAAHLAARESDERLGPGHIPIREQLVRLLRDSARPTWKRAIAGDALALVGDPRFLSGTLSLIDEPLFGFVHIPAGLFLMGQGKTLREVELSEYFISRYPVTNRQFRAFLDSSAHDPVLGPGKGLDNHPASPVAYRDAAAYCGWLQQRLLELGPPRSPEARAFWDGLQDGTLSLTVPSEAEWEKATGGSDGRRYPWGDVPDPDRANYWDTGIGRPTVVGCFPGGASVWGVEDLSGNVEEWTRDTGDREGGAAAAALRGGDFSATRASVTCSSRRPRDTSFADFLGLAKGPATSGFRVAASPVRH